MLRARTRGNRRIIISFCFCWALSWLPCTSSAALFSVTNLVTDDQTVNPAQITDPFLKNAWGISRSAGSPFWVSENATGVATLYQVNPNTDATTKVILGSPPGASGGV